MKRTTCRLCDSTDLELAVKVPPMPIVDGYTKKPNALPCHPCDLYFCHACGHIQILDVLPPEWMFMDYQFKTGDWPHLIEHYRQYADYCKSNFDASFVVEVGCNDGTLLKMFDGKTLGIDPSNIPCEAAKVSEFLSEDVARQIVKAHGHATLVIANHVFAHADDLAGFLEAVKLLLTSRGAFCFEVAYAQDMLDRTLLEQIEHEHLSYHSIAPLYRFMNRHGMEITDYSRNDCKGGSIRCAATFIDSGQQPAFAENCGIESLKRFADNIRTMRDKLSAINSAIGYGASAPCTSVIYQLGLEKRLRFLVDDNPKRHGLYSPSANLPIVPSSAIYDFDLPIIILANRYDSEIIARHPLAKERFLNIHF